MAKFYKQLDEKIIQFIQKQKIFFCATTPKDGRINLSPKGMDTFRVLDNHTVGFLSVTGSGNETAAHLMEDGRITIMFCSFDDQPLILRLYGRGECIYPDNTAWAEIAKSFDILAGTRQIFIITIESLQTSCGYSIPFYDYKGEREALVKWAQQKGDEGVKEYQNKNNQHSIDGIGTGLSTDDL